MRTAFLHPFAKPTQDDFVEIVAGEGAEVTDADGRRYVDAMASLWYCNVGHGRAEIADAIAEQARTLAGFHTFDKFTNPPAEALTAKVAELSVHDAPRVFLTSSGSEAVDSAVKLARLTQALEGATERTGIVSREPSYHGVTLGGMSLTGMPANREHFGPLLGGVERVGHDDLDAVEKRLAGGDIAAVIAEPVIGAAGVHPPSPGYLQGLRERCDAHGALLVFDEVITGFGRLGTWWGAQRYDVQPDLQTFAKAVTSGYVPLGGVIAGPRVRAALESDPAFVLRHGHTYSGHPTACAAGVAALEILQRENLPANVPRIEAQLGGGLHALAEAGQVAEARGDGAVWAVGLRSDQNAVVVRDGMLEHGVIPRPIGTDTLAFCPPLVITDAQLDQVLGALSASL